MSFNPPARPPGNIRPVRLLRVWVSESLTQADSQFSGVGIVMSVEFHREFPGKFDSRTLNRKTLNRWTGRNIPIICYNCMSSAL